MKYRLKDLGILSGILLTFASSSFAGGPTETFSQMEKNFGDSKAINAQLVQTLLGRGTVRCQDTQLSNDEISKLVPRESTSYQEEIRLFNDGLSNFLMFRLKEMTKNVAVAYMQCEFLGFRLDARDERTVVVPFGPFRRNINSFQNMTVERKMDYVEGGRLTFSAHHDESNKNEFIVNYKVLTFKTLPDKADLKPALYNHIRGTLQHKSCAGGNRTADVYRVNLTTTASGAKHISMACFANTHHKHFFGFGSGAHDDQDENKVGGDHCLVGKLDHDITFVDGAWRLVYDMEPEVQKVKASFLGVRALDGLIKTSAGAAPYMSTRELFDDIIAPHLLTLMIEKPVVAAPAAAGVLP